MRKATLAGWMVALSLVQARAEGPVIGLAVTDGRIELDRAGVSGNATLREGASLKTGKAAARIQLQNGARATVGIESEAKIYRDRLELARGAASAGERFRVAAGAFTIQAGPGAAAQVLRQKDAVEVAAVEGSVTVRGANGLMIAKVLPAQPLRLEPGTPGVSAMTGVLRQEQGAFRLTDETTNLDVALRGENLGAHTGRRVQVSGQAQADGDSQLVLVAHVTEAPEQQTGGAAKPTTGAAKPGAKAPPPARTGGTGGGGGMSAGAKIGLIAALGGGAAAAAVLLGGGSSSSPAISR